MLNKWDAWIDARSCLNLSYYHHNCYMDGIPAPTWGSPMPSNWWLRELIISYEVYLFVRVLQYMEKILKYSICTYLIVYVFCTYIYIYIYMHILHDNSWFGWISAATKLFIIHLVAQATPVALTRGVPTQAEVHVPHVAHVQAISWGAAGSKLNLGSKNK